MKITTSKLLYYIFSTVFGFYCMKDSDFLPTWYYGQNPDANLMNLYKNHPVQEFTYESRMYIFQCTGFHLYCLLNHLYMPRRNDFWEMNLHHIVTCYLLVMSYLLSIERTAMIINFLHDHADIPMCLAKLLSDTNFSNATILAAITMLVAWFHSRIYAFPYFIYYSTCEATPDHLPTDVISLTSWRIFAFLLCTLLVLHVYWFILVLKKVVSSISNPNEKIEDP